MLGKQFVFAAWLVAALTATTAPARADGLRPLQLDVAGGVRFGGDSSIADLRLFLGGVLPVARAGDSGRVFASAGAYASLGTVSVDDERGIDDRVSRSRSAVGPELRAGLMWGDRWPDLYLYAAVAPFVTFPGREGPVDDGDEAWALGGRAAIGLAVPSSYREAWESSDDGCQGGGCSMAMLLALLPNTLEITAEHTDVVDGPRTRYGFGLGYSF